MSDIYFEGDPAQDSARRHLERVLKEPPRRRWPFLAGLFAGGTAFALWRLRQHRKAAAATAEGHTSQTEGRSAPSGNGPAAATRPSRQS